MNPKVIYKKTRAIELPQPEAGRVWEKDDKLTCPRTKSYVFATVPEIRIRGQIIFPSAPIYLRYGEHHAANHGWGFVHAWKEHFRGHHEESRAMHAVCKAMSEVLVPGAEIYFDSQQYQDRAQVLRTSLVIIQYRPEADPCYSVITGPYYAKNTKGSLVGALV